MNFSSPSRSNLFLVSIGCFNTAVTPMAYTAMRKMRIAGPGQAHGNQQVSGLISCVTWKRNFYTLVSFWRVFVIIYAERETGNRYTQEMECLRNTYDIHLLLLLFSYIFDLAGSNILVKIRRWRILVPNYVLHPTAK